MRLIINTATTFKGGGVQVAKSFIEECKVFPDHEFHVILGANIGKTIDRMSFPSNFTFYDIDYRPATKIFSLQNSTKFFKDIESKVKPDAVFTTSGPAYWKPKAPHLVGYNLPHFIYPDSPFFKIIPFWKVVRWKLRGAVKSMFLKNEASAFVVQTDDVNIRLKKWLKVENVYTVSNSCNSHYFKANSFSNKLKAKEANEFRFLLLSAYHPHKNFEIIRKVIDHELEKGNVINMRFVLTLPQDIYNSIFPVQYHKYIYNVGPVPVSECASLYKECDAMFLPTLLECFSASYVEAMYMEKPIVTSNLGFATTVCGDSALYFDPLNEIDIAQKLKMIIDDSELRESLVEKGTAHKVNFKTAKQRAESYIELCKMIRKPSNLK